MPHLLAISIGPVQEFIASARRSRDLWFGSWLLSELSKAAAKQVGKDNLIFPSVTVPEDLNPGSEFNVVNKILAKVADGEQDVKDLCKAIEAAIKQRLNELAGDAFDRLPQNKTRFHRDVAEKQLENLVEFYWAALPLNGDYAKARDAAEALLAARKATRDFQKVGWQFNEAIAHAPKSSLDGQRESVIDESVYDTLSKDELYKQFGVRQGERLCGVGLLKRHGNRQSSDGTRNDGFFSTSHVAALPLLEQLKNEVAVKKYIKALRGCGLHRNNGLNSVPRLKDSNKKIVNRHPAFRFYDGHLLFEERLADYIDQKKPGGKDKLDRARAALRDFLKTALNNQQPFPYYALLLADGDNMGKAIDAKAQEGWVEHQKLSARLSAFAQSVRDIVQVNHKGSLVYAGGDDVLAFVPLHKVLACARALADKFKGDLVRFQFTDKNGKKNSPSLSVGVAVVHHLNPLSDALDLAHRAEKRAKDAGRNALAVTISKRSGVAFTVKGQWGDIDSRLQYFTCLHRAEAIPDGAAYELRQLSKDLSDLPPEAKRVEAERILKRKRVKNEKLRDDVLKELAKHINDLNLSLEDLANELIAARTFARAMKQAGITVKEIAHQGEQKKEDAK